MKWGLSILKYSATLWELRPPRYPLKWRVQDLVQEARLRFFGYNPIGCWLLDKFDRLHSKHPQSAIVHRIWFHCLPF